MTWINYEDILGQLQANGFELDRVDLAKRKRVKIAGNSQKGWYSLYEIQLDGGDRALVGSYGWWIGGETFVHKFDLKVDKKKLALTADQREAAKARADADRRQSEAEEAKRHEAASQKASRWWRQLLDAGESAYLARKGFAAGKLYGARISKAGNLVVPIQDATGKIFGLQVIFPTKGNRGRDKDFTPPGLQKKAHFFQIGLAQRGGVVLLCEGFATGASLHEATGLPVVVAFDAGNLLPVAQALHKAHRRDIRILVCADDDYLTEGNPGRMKSEAAALAVGGHVVWPIFPGERPADRKGPTDFNDLHVHPDGGLRMVAAQVEAAIATAGWRVQKLAARGGAVPKGDGEVHRPDAMSIMPIDDLVERFIPIDDGSGKVLFDQQTKRIVQKTQMIEMLPAGARGDDIKRHPVWVSRGAVYVDQIGFDPSGADSQVKLNTWRGWSMKPKAGKCERIIGLLTYLCSSEGDRPDMVRWVLCWMAYPLQHPGAKMQSALMVHGPQGTGKSTVFKVLAEIYGHKDSYRNYSIILDQKALESKYNSDWDSKLYVLAEEVINSSDKWQLKNELKELVTGDRIRIEKKFLDAYYQANRANLVFLSNEDAPLPLDNDDRRHCVIWTPPPVDLAYYAEVREEIENGGTEAFYHYLLHLDLGDFRPWSRPPMTQAKQSLIDASKSSEDEFFQDWIAGETPYPVCACRGDDLFAAYLQHCQRMHERNVANRRRFRIKLAHMRDWQHRKQVHVHDTHHCLSQTRQVRLEIPGDSWITKAQAKKDYRHQAGETQAAWATRCMLDFAKALEENRPGMSAG